MKTSSGLKKITTKIVDTIAIMLIGAVALAFAALWGAFDTPSEPRKYYDARVPKGASYKTPSATTFEWESLNKTSRLQDQSEVKEFKVYNVPVERPVRPVRKLEPLDDYDTYVQGDYYKSQKKIQVSRYKSGCADLTLTWKGTEHQMSHIAKSICSKVEGWQGYSITQAKTAAIIWEVCKRHDLGFTDQVCSLVVTLGGGEGRWTRGISEGASAAASISKTGNKGKGTMQITSNAVMKTCGMRRSDRQILFNNIKCAAIHMRMYLDYYKREGHSGTYLNRLAIAEWNTGRWRAATGLKRYPETKGLDRRRAAIWRDIIAPALTEES